jgi:succinate-semialdehyde dehydrogenase/glutarate-semialdehyde dehydrogenase
LRFLAMTLRTINPATGRLVRDWDETRPDALERIVARAGEVTREWSESPFSERAQRMQRVASLLRERAGDHARLMAEEMGKPLPQGRAESEKCAWVAEHYAAHAERYLSPEPAETEGGRAYVAFPPLGVVLAIMPWNFPFWQVLRFAAPALMAGNAVLLKHAPGVQGCARAIEDLLRDAGLPRGLLANLAIPEARVEGVIRDSRVHAVTLTGSPRAGRAVAQAAGAALKKTVLELGGSDPYVILEDADVDAAAATCVASRLINGGQSCVAAKRFVVVDAVRERFTERVVELMRTKTWGDPLGGRDPDLGPLARADLRDALHRQVERSVAAGAELLLGGAVPAREGAWYPPTVLAGVRRGMPAYSEETFGPVACILPARDENDAVAIANDSPYGLGAAVFTRDRARGERIARDRLQAGCCFVNDFVRSDPRLPFGGIKESGWGRELGVFGIREFVDVKTVFVAD